MAKAKKKAAKAGRSTADPVLSATDMVQRSLAKHEEISPAKVTAQVSAYMRALGKKGGTVSGAKRMENLTSEKRSEIALKAARARWAKSKRARA